MSINVDVVYTGNNNPQYVTTVSLFSKTSNSREARFCIDTGCDTTFISPYELNQLIPNLNIISLPSISTILAGGVESESYFFLLPKMEFKDGTVIWKIICNTVEIDSKINESSYTSLLGMNVLKFFNFNSFNNESDCDECTKFKDTFILNPRFNRISHHFKTFRGAITPKGERIPLLFVEDSDMNLF